MRFWKKKEKKQEENKPTNIYRLTYRLRNGNLPLIAEMIIKSKKEREQIDFEKAVKLYWSKNEQKMELDEILIVDKVGEE